ncbi:MAG: hypothetical protein RRA92_09025 [Gemmatimonadota bacterium]|nr:hypothetical protein [Gemmatimonadota bacterium]
MSVPDDRHPTPRDRPARRGPAGRTWLAAAVLLAWIGVAGLHARRVHFPSRPERLSRAARTLPPGDAWYALTAAGKRAGWARRQVDTLAGGGFLVREEITWDLPDLPGTGRSQARLAAWLDAGLALDSLRFDGVADGDTVRLTAAVEGDSVLVLDGGERRPVDGPPQLAATWPLRFAADAAAREEGGEIAVPLFEPATRTVRELRLRVGASRLRVWPDSADTDSLTGAWFAAREDSARAWRLERVQGALRLATWVDEDGRVVEADLPGGLHMERTAFELAFLAGRGPAEGEPEGTP